MIFNYTLKPIIALTFFLGTIICCQAQHYDVKLFDARAEKTKSKVTETIREYNRIQKEYRQYIKVRKQAYREVKDSVNSGFFENLDHNFSRDSVRQVVQSQQEYFVYTDSLYSLMEIAGWDHDQLETKQRSVSLLKSKLQGNAYVVRYLDLESEISSFGSIIKIYRDSLKSIETLERDEIRFLVSRKKKELSEKYEGNLASITRDFVTERVPVLPDGFENKQLADFHQVNGYLKNSLDKEGLIKMSRAQAMDHFNVKHESLKIATNEVAELKKKFSDVPDSNDLSSAKKHNSLKGNPIKNRMVYGGTFQLHVNGETKIDLNPELGYNLNKRLEIGFGGTYRLMVKTSDLPQAYDKRMVMGLRAYIEHKLIKHFYVHGEYESLKSSMYKNGEHREGLWYNSFLMGMERRFVLKGKFQGQAQVLYNFNSRNNSLYSSPWVFRIGFNVSGEQ